MKTKWDLTLLYDSLDDPRIEKDVKAIERAYKKFEKTYRNTHFTKDAPTLLRALQDHERLEKKVCDMKPLQYLSYRTTLNSDDAKARAQSRLLSERLTKAALQIAFFDIEIGKIDKEKQEVLLKDTRLARYHYLLECIFKEAPHQLSEPEEHILARLQAPAHGMWTSGVEHALTRRTVLFEGKELPLFEAMDTAIKVRNTTKRRELGRNIVTKMREVGEFAESELNAVLTNKKIRDELRGLQNPYTATLLGDEIDEKTVRTLVDVVSEHFTLAHRFYRIKKRVLGLSHLELVDTNIPIEKAPATYTFKTSVRLIREVLQQANPSYASFFDQMLEHGYIDAYPAKRKHGGAFCSSNHAFPAFVLTNHTDDVHSLAALAHEMGHAIHFERSKCQPIHYQDATIASTEVASTFFEGLTYDFLYAHARTKKEQMHLLHDVLFEDIGSIFRQIAFFNFEEDLHTAVREQGWISQDEIAKRFHSHIKKQVGSAVRLLPQEGYRFIYVHHFRRFFYVYTYALGQLVSRALRERYHADPTYIEKVDEFLRAGSSKPFREIFADIGVDVHDPSFFKEGLNGIKRDLDAFEKLVKRS